MVFHWQIDQQALAIVIFLLTYVFIVTGWRERTIAALFGVAALWILGVVESKELLKFVNLEAISLLFGMMVIVGGLRQAGFFRWIGIHMANLCRCRASVMLVVFPTITALLSAFLDNVTTVLFMVTVTIEILEILKINPMPFIMAEILAANIGGTATLIGDPPNIIIATAANLTFLDFVYNVAPLATVGLGAMLVFTYKKYQASKWVGGEFEVVPVRPAEAVNDPTLFKMGVPIFLGTIVAMSAHQWARISPATVALIGGIAFLAAGGPKMPQVLEKIEWNTLMFFGALFVIVGSLEKTGAIHAMSSSMVPLIGSNELIAVTVVLWFSSLASAIIDNIPFTAAFIPIITDISNTSGLNVKPFLWSLSLGTGFGGNGTIIASSANIVATALAASRGYPINFKDFMRVGMTVLVITTALGNLVLVARLIAGF